MATAKPKTDIELAEFYERKAKEYRARAASSKFHDAIGKHKTALTSIYTELKVASGKQRGMDADILAAVAEAMGMKGMTITKRVQQRSKSK